MVRFFVINGKNEFKDMTKNRSDHLYQKYVVPSLIENESSRQRLNRINKTLKRVYFDAKQAVEYGYKLSVEKMESENNVFGIATIGFKDFDFQLGIGFLVEQILYEEFWATKTPTTFETRELLCSKAAKLKIEDGKYFFLGYVEIEDIDHLSYQENGSNIEIGLVWPKR